VAKRIYLQVLSQDMLKKYITYAKLNVFPKIHDADLDKISHVYAELRRESSVIFLLGLV
jgi:DNA replication licensing factor MCM2